MWLVPSDIFQVGDADREQIRIRTKTFHADNAVDGNHEISTEMEGVRGPSCCQSVISFVLSSTGWIKVRKQYGMTGADLMPHMTELEDENLHYF